MGCYLQGGTISSSSSRLNIQGGNTMKISKIKILNALKTTGNVVKPVLKSKAFWVAVGSMVSLILSDGETTTIDPSNHTTVVVNGVEAIVCAILGGCF